jgi:hypothetical protein
MHVCGAYKAAANISKSCGTRHWVIRKALSTAYYLRGPLHFTAAPNTDSESLTISYWCLVGVVDNMCTVLRK